MSYGATYDEALNMDIRGCFEIGIRSNEVSTGTGYVNALKSVEYVFSNGFDSRTNKQFGLKTGELKNLKTFDDFYSAVLKQWENLIEMTIDVSLQYEKYLSFINPSNMYSATIEGALKKGIDAYQSGVKFNNSHVLNCGFASIPYIPNYNDNQISQIAEFLRTLKGIVRVRILPYHNYAASKYTALNIKNTLPPCIPAESEIKKADTGYTHWADRLWADPHSRIKVCEFS
mgnify:FL=1